MWVKDGERRCGRGSGFGAESVESRRGRSERSVGRRRANLSPEVEARTSLARVHHPESVLAQRRRQHGTQRRRLVQQQHQLRVGHVVERRFRVGAQDHLRNKRASIRSIKTHTHTHTHTERRQRRPQKEAMFRPNGSMLGTIKSKRRRWSGRAGGSGRVRRRPATATGTSK